MGQHKQQPGMHQLVMGGGQYQMKKLCLWGLCMVIPFLVLFCIFPSGSSLYRPPDDRIVVSTQLDVPRFHHARPDLNTVSSDDAVDNSEGAEEEEEEEGRVSILDEPDFAPKKEKKQRGGRRRVKKHRRKRGSRDPIITPLLDKEPDKQANAEDVQPEESSIKPQINHEEETIPDTAIEEETSISGKKAANQDDEVLNQDDEAVTSAARFTHGRHKLDKEEEEEEKEVSPLGKESEPKEEDPTNPGSKSKGLTKATEESNAAAAEDAVFFSDIEKKTDDTTAEAEAKTREKKSSKVKESSGKRGDDASEQSAESDGGGKDLLAEADRVAVENFLTKQSGKCKYHEGKWIIDDSAKPSKDLTCTLMSVDDQQTCAHERNITKPSSWTWQSSSCEVEHFNTKTFLKMMQKKSLAFVGDKLAKAQMESLLCLLAQVEKPSLIYDDKTNKSSSWHFSSSNFTISMLWSPHLVREVYDNGYKKLHLDRLDTMWAIPVPTIDVLVLGVGARFIEPTIYTVHNEIVGCSSCKALLGQSGFGDMKEMSLYSGFRATMRSALMGVGSLPGFRGITLFLQPHGFEGNGSYDGVSTKMKEIQEEELYEAYKRGSISNLSKMEVVHTDFISMSKGNNMEAPPTTTCLVPSPLSHTWNKVLHHTLTRLLAS